MSDKSLPSFRKRFAPLSRKTINDLAAKAHQGCIASRNKIIEHNLGLIPVHCKNAIFGTNPAITFEDCYQQGVLGIIDAIKNYDPSRGFAFSTYAVFWIRQRIQRYIQDHKSIVRVPVYALEIKRRYDKIKQMNSDKDDDFWVRLVASQCKTTFDNVLFILKTNPTICSIDSEADDGAAIQVSYDLFDDEYHAGLDFDHIQRIIKLLPCRDREILLQRYGGATLKELGRVHGVTHQRCQQIISNSLHKLRAMVSVKTQDAPHTKNFSTSKYGKSEIKTTLKKH